ncbi:unnamed protein product [Rhizophagus irregularis]|uniref:Uncharacterized protein n=1 Tax=Rhizophagus irregularis TaxID=588596 RepID=A0A915ZQ95_9GLOM|nr:unnamed protein product [Rhizophagus irregularis]
MESRAVTSSFFIEKISILIGIAIIMYTVKPFRRKAKATSWVSLKISDSCNTEINNAEIHTIILRNRIDHARIEILPWRRKAFSIELITSSKSLMISMNERLAAQPRLLNKEVLGTWVHRV